MLNQYQVSKMLFGLFLRKLEVSDYRKLVESLPWRLPEFDGQPAVNNAPANTPPDVPRARFTSKDGRKILEVAPAKLQFFMIPGDMVEGPNPGIQMVNSAAAFERFTPQALRIFNVFSEHFGLTAVRLGIMTEFFGFTGGSANQHMQKYFLNNGAFFGERLHELNIAALSKTTLTPGGRGVNRWVRVRPLRQQAENSPDIAMGVEVDINTLQEDTYDLTAADVESFTKGVGEHIETQVPLFNDENLFKD